MMTKQELNERTRPEHRRRLELTLTDDRIAAVVVELELRTEELEGRIRTALANSLPAADLAYRRTAVRELRAEILEAWQVTA